MPNIEEIAGMLDCPDESNVKIGESYNASLDKIHNETVKKLTNAHIEQQIDKQVQALAEHMSDVLAIEEPYKLPNLYSPYTFPDLYPEGHNPYKLLKEAELAHARVKKKCEILTKELEQKKSKQMIVESSPKTLKDVSGIRDLDL